jgi:hypothetical protein
LGGAISAGVLEATAASAVLEAPAVGVLEATAADVLDATTDGMREAGSGLDPTGAGGGAGSGGRELSAVQPIDSTRDAAIGPTFTLIIS